jgi:hypothetical protein
MSRSYTHLLLAPTLRQGDSFNFYTLFMTERLYLLQRFADFTHTVRLISYFIIDWSKGMLQSPAPPPN